jgi:AraC family transcriptional activator FtrA
MRPSRRALPAIQVQPDDLYVDAGQLITAAGSAAGWTCCCIWCGATMAADRAIRWRSGWCGAASRSGQAQFLPRPMALAAATGSRLMDWLRASGLPHTARVAWPSMP